MYHRSLFKLSWIFRDFLSTTLFCFRHKVRTLDPNVPLNTKIPGGFYCLKDGFCLNNFLFIQESIEVLSTIRSAVVSHKFFPYNFSYNGKQSSLHFQHIDMDKWFFVWPVSSRWVVFICSTPTIWTCIWKPIRGCNK